MPPHARGRALNKIPKRRLEIFHAIGRQGVVHELVDHKSCAHRLGSLGYQPGPSKPELDARLSSTNRHSAFFLLLFYYGDAFLALKERGVSCAAVLVVRLPPPYPASPG